MPAFTGHLATALFTRARFDPGVGAPDLPAEMDRR
jgi:hypothetical protein